MKHTKFKEAIERLGLTQEGIGRLFGYGGRAVRWWVAGERRIPTPVAILVRLLLRRKITVKDIIDASKPDRDIG